MLVFVLSPAKSLDLGPVNVAATAPSFVSKTNELVGLMQQRSSAQIKSLLGISDALATLNAERYRDWDDAATKPAVLAFDGPAYRSLLLDEVDAGDLDYLQQHLRILSGLYGLLRPLDAIKPHRLEMGTKLPNSAGKTLVDFWRDDVTTALRQMVGVDGCVVNCASQEYAKVVGDVPMLTIAFPGPAVYAKQARGAMVRFAMQRRVTDAQALKEFTGNHGEWSFDEAASEAHSYVFRRTSGAKPAAKRQKKAP